MNPIQLQKPLIRTQASRLAEMAIADAGVLVLDVDLNVLGANAAARGMATLGDAFCLDAGQLRALRNEDDAQLREACCRAVAGAEDEWHGMLLARSSGQRDYLISMAGVSLPDFPTDGLHLIIIDPEKSLCLTAGQLQTFFALTTAQAALAHLLGNGHRLEEAAVILGIKISTARSHLAEVFRKTRTDRIQALVRLLATLWSATRLQKIVTHCPRLPDMNEAAALTTRTRALSSMRGEFHGKQ